MVIQDTHSAAEKDSRWVHGGRVKEQDSRWVHRGRVKGHIFCRG